ncbi:MAG: putative ABC transporter permease [Coriobacteriia bacterium]|nr:putative ABC transporter permease [Coriobacteriia bacterium]
MANTTRTPDLDSIERAFSAADAAAGADRAAITQSAQLDAAEAVAMVGIAMEADEEAAEAKRMAMLAERSGDKEAASAARSRERAARKKAKADHKAATKSAKAAYDAVRFSDPDGLGFLYVILVMLGCNIIFTTFLLTTYIKGSYSIGFNETLDLINVLIDGVTFWLIWKHKEFARTWVIATSLFNIVVGTAFNLATGVFSPIAQVTLSAFDIFLLVYFLTSSRVKATLVEPFNVRTLNDDLDEEESFFRPKTWEFWRNLIVYFVVFSIVGHWMEAAVCLLIKYGIVPGIYDPTSQIWSDFLYPFPVYGIGFCVCALMFYPLKLALQRKFKKTLPALLITYVVSAFICTCIEFTLGMLTNQDLQLWDYSTMFCNFMGQVCLQNSLFFGFAATLMTWLVYPALERLFRRIPNEAGTYVLIVAVVGFALLAALYFINLPAEQVQQAVQGTADTLGEAAVGTTGATGKS